MILKTLREEVLEANLELVRRGLVLYTFGNASGIARDQNLVVIKPSGVPYDKMRPEDLVVTDLSMPNMNGLKLCQRLREISSVPIIVLSVKGDEATKVEALDAGADDYVTKPFGMGELLARVRAALRRSPAAGRPCLHR